MDATEVFVSSASLWEIAIKVKLKKLKANVDDLISAIDESGFTELPITSKHVAQVSLLPDVHRDPFDRILIAQMLSEPLRLMTKDTLLQSYSELVMLV
jgi:PIN domain nuclease of toxin-antitoxin system